MTDEQAVSIYLSPEEELTSVRERLEKTQARRIILVIPSQTQLRSHVGWRLIHARMRELGKHLLVVSPDRQVRAVARAAGFDVAESQETSSNRSRPGGGTRPGTFNTRGSARSRLGNSRGASDSRASQTGRRSTSGMSNRSRSPLPPPEPESYDEEKTLERSLKPQPEPEENTPLASPPTLFKAPDAPIRLPGSIHISTTPSVRPSVPGGFDDEAEDDTYLADYQTARRIRESASGGGANEQAARENELESRGSASSKWGHDPFIYMQEEPQAPVLPEQKGSVPGPFEEPGTNVPDISDRSTEIMQNEIEDLGDLGPITPPQITSLPAPTAREKSARTRQHSPRAPRPLAPGLDDDDELLEIPDRPTQMNRPSKRQSGGTRQPSQSFKGGMASPGTQRPSQALRAGPPQQANPRPSQALRPPAGPRPSQSLRSGASQQANPRPSQGLRSGTPQQAGPRPSQGLRPSQPMPGAQRQRAVSVAGGRPPVLPQASANRQIRGTARANKRGGRGLTIFFVAIVLLLFVLGVLFYFVPTAAVTVSLQAQSYTQTLQLSASADAQNTAPGHVQAQTLTHDFSVSDGHKASGQTKVGNAAAQGLVTFTNNGSIDVTIPTNTIITTSNGTAFATAAEAFVAHGQSQPAVPVSAQQSGDTGNVAANSITVLPTSSVSGIAQRNHVNPNAINLAVTNPQATSGGGMQNVAAVTQGDLDALKHSLHLQLQQQIGAWLSAQTHPGDLHGAPQPDVQGSANPLPAEQFSGAPSVNTAESSGSFSGTLSVHLSVLFASASAIKVAAGVLLNASAQNQRPASMLATQLPITLNNEKGTPSKDGSSLAISVKATGAIVRQISLQDLSANLAGKSVAEATSYLKTSIAGVQDVQISISPSFLGFMPQRADRIQIILQPIRQAPPIHVSNS